MGNTQAWLVEKAAAEVQSSPSSPVPSVDEASVAPPYRVVKPAEFEVRSSNKDEPVRVQILMLHFGAKGIRPKEGGEGSFDQDFLKRWRKYFRDLSKQNSLFIGAADDKDPGRCVLVLLFDDDLGDKSKRNRRIAAELETLRDHGVWHDHLDEWTYVIHRGSKNTAEQDVSYAERGWNDMEVVFPAVGPKAGQIQWVRWLSRDDPSGTIRTWFGVCATPILPKAKNDEGKGKPKESAKKGEEAGAEEEQEGGPVGKEEQKE